jgi:hypothetical protein
VLSSSIAQAMEFKISVLGIVYRALLANVLFKLLSIDGRLICHIAPFLRLFVPNSLTVHHPFGGLPVSCVLRHYRSVLSFPRPEQPLDRVRGDPDASLRCSYGSKLSERLVAPSYASEGFGPSTLYTFCVSVMGQEIR